MRALVLILFVLGPALATSAQDAAPLASSNEAEIEADSDLALAAVARGDILPLSELLPRLLAAFPGEVLDIEIDLDTRGRIEEYEFEVLTPEGRLIEVDMDAATGEVTEVSDEEPEDNDDEED